ncbi:C40 family peptidase [Sulfuricystis multivorans]|uniref:C40 family peptidase n=1 Tax=Sulfuricystis multivorans TaxID=2211108 RepID=UPI000F826DD9
MKKTLTTSLFLLCVAAAPVQAVETVAQLPAGQATPVEPTPPASFMSRAVDNVGSTLERALDFLGIRYQRGGSSPETGFDCSGFVRYVYGETLGLILPHNAKAISQAGEKVDKSELQPGDLVFFNTMRRAFSHVGIYLGDNLFVHAPRAGARVRIEDMTNRYWSRRFNGARRLRP